MVTVRVVPEEGLIDEELHITIEGLKAGQKITIYTALSENGSGEFYSYAHYTANSNGNVDMSMHKSEGGSFTGTNSMGLFCTMVPSASNKYGLRRLVIQNVELPLKFKLSIYNQYLLPDEVASKTSLSEIFIKRWYKRSGVKKIVVQNGRLHGSLFVPEGTGPFPALVDIFGSAGGLMEFRAALLASRGFLTFSLAYCKYKDLPEHIIDVDMQYFEEAKNFLMKQDAVEKDCGIGVIGVSSGATIALAAASYIPGFKCCVSINGPIIAQYSSLHFKNRSLQAVFPDVRRASIINNAFVSRHVLDGFDIEPDSRYTIEFFKSDCSFLLLFCEDDMCVNGQKHKDAAERLLHGSSCDHEVRVYHGAGHLLEPPFSPHAAITFDRLINMPQHWGGNSSDHAIAQSKAWADILSFLSRKLKSPSKL